MKLILRYSILAFLFFMISAAVWAQDSASLVPSSERLDKLRLQLSEMKTLEAGLQDRIRSLDIDLQPDNLQRAINQFGTLSADALREQRRRLLENEKARITDQLRLVSDSVVSLEKTIGLAEIEIARMKAAIATAAQNAGDNSRTARFRNSFRP